MDLDQAPEAIREPAAQALRSDTERPGDGVDRADPGTLDSSIERRAGAFKAVAALFVATGGAHRAQLAVALGEAAAEGAGGYTERALDLGDGAADTIGHHPVQGTAQPGVTAVPATPGGGGETARRELGSGG